MTQVDFAISMAIILSVISFSLFYTVGYYDNNIDNIRGHTLDEYVDGHHNREVAEAFIKYLKTKKIQRIFANYGFRPVDETVMEELLRKFSIPSQLVDISILNK